MLQSNLEPKTSSLDKLMDISSLSLVSNTNSKQKDPISSPYLQAPGYKIPEMWWGEIYTYFGCLLCHLFYSFRILVRQRHFLKGGIREFFIMWFTSCCLLFPILWYVLVWRLLWGTVCVCFSLCVCLRMWGHCVYSGVSLGAWWLARKQTHKQNTWGKFCKRALISLRIKNK